MAKARILVATHVAGIAVACGDAIDADASIVSNLVALGEADDHPDAVAYAEETAPAIVIPNAAAADEEIDLEKLTKDQLVELAAERYGLALDAKTKKDDLIAAIVEADKAAAATKA
jgi:hypothetical protein